MKAAQKIAAHYLNKMLSLTDPIFNLREITKQMLLLEDHLFHANKECSDCITKHLLTIEALADEGLTFGAGYDNVFEAVIKQAKNALISLQDGKQHAAIGLCIRKTRKALVPWVFDPRTVEKEVPG